MLSCKTELVQMVNDAAHQLGCKGDLNCHCKLDLHSHADNYSLFSYLLRQLESAWQKAFDAKAHVATPSEKERVLRDLQNRYYSLIERPVISMKNPTLFYQQFEMSVSKNPDSIAIIYKDVKWTYQQLNRKINRLAHKLLDLKRANGWNNGDAVALFFENSPEAVVAILAVMKAGLSYVPLTVDDKLPLERLSYYVDLSQPKCIITQDHLQNHPLVYYIKYKNNTLPIFQFKEVSANSQCENPDEEISAEQRCYITFTSGSTGVPKGIAIAHRGLLAPVNAISEQFTLTPNDKICWHSLLTFDASLLDIMLPLANGASLVIIPQAMRTNGAHMTAYLQCHKVSHLIMVPSVLETLDPGQLPNLRGYISMGEKGREKLFARFNTEGRTSNAPRLGLNGFGPSEATICTSCGTFVAGEIISIGKEPIPGLQWFILSLPTKEDPYPRAPNTMIDGSEGELYISGEGLALGYLQSTGHNPGYHHRFRAIPHPSKPGQMLRVYQTGDIVKKVDGQVCYVRRVDEEEKYLGERIHPVGIETALLEFTTEDGKPVFKNAKVFVERQQDKLPTLSAFFELIAPVKHTGKLIRELNLFLHHHPFVNIIPSRFRLIDEWPTNQNGKSDVAQLKAKKTQPIYCASPLGLVQSDQLDQNILKFITAVWHEVLNIAEGEIKISLDDNFYNLGGNSIATNLMFRKISKKYPKYLYSYVEFNTCPTLRALVYRVSKANHDSPPNVVLKFSHSKKFANLLKAKKLPIVLVNSVSGSAESDFKLVKTLLEKQLHNWPIICTESPALTNPGYVVSSLENLAADYINSLTNNALLKDYDGAYILMGYSAGGALAYEMAAQLQKRGVACSVCCIDTLSPVYYQNLSQTDYAKEIYNLMGHTCALLGVDRDEVEALISLLQLQAYPKTQQLSLYWHKFMEYAANASDANKEQYLGVYITLQNLVNTQLSYTPAKAECATLISFSQTREKSNDNALSWADDLALTNITIDGKHLDVVKDENWCEHVLMPNLIRFCMNAKYRMMLTPLIKKNQQLFKGPAVTHMRYVVDNRVELVSINDCIKNLYQGSLDLDLESLYHDLCEFPGRKICFVGNSGSGKSAICQFIANQWANENCTVAKSFDLVLCLNIDQLDANNPPAELMQLSELEGDSSVLLILDGIEKLPAKSKLTDQITMLLQNNNLSVIATSRPGNKIPDLTFDATVQLNFCNTKIVPYITDLLEKMNKQDLIKPLLNQLAQNSVLTSLLQTPLHVSLLCRYWLHCDAVSQMVIDDFGFSKFIVDEIWERYATYTSASSGKSQQKLRNVLESIAAKAWPGNFLTIEDMDKEIRDIIGSNDLKQFRQDLLDTGLLTGSERGPDGAFKKVHFLNQITEYLTVEYLVKNLNQDNHSQFERFRPLINKYKVLYDSTRTYDDNVVLRHLLATSVIKSLPELDRNEILRTIAEGYVVNQIQESALYKAITTKVKKDGVRIIEKEMKKINSDYNLKTACIKILTKPKNSLSDHVDKNESYFVGKSLSLADPDMDNSIFNAEILSMQRVSANTMEFSLEKDIKLKIDIGLDRAITKAVVIKQYQTNLFRYLIAKGSYNHDTIDKEVTITIKPTSGSIMAEILASGNYRFSVLHRRRFSHNETVAVPTSNSGGFKKVLSYLSAAVGQAQHITQPVYSRSFRLIDKHNQNYLIEMFDRDSQDGNLVFKISPSLQEKSFDLTANDLTDCYTYVPIDSHVKGITTQNAKDKIILKELGEDEHKIKNRIFDKIESRRADLLTCLKDAKNQAVLNTLLDSLISNGLKNISEDVLFDVQAQLAGVEDLLAELHAISDLYDSIGITISIEKIITDLALQAIYCRLVQKERTLDVLHAMELLKKGFDNIQDVKDKSLVIFLGNTGAGKSTLICRYLGYDLELVESKYGHKIIKIDESQLDPNRPYPVIGESIGSSGTTYIHGYKLADSEDELPAETIRLLRLCDGPGWRDTRGIAYDLSAVLSMDHTVSNAKNIQAIVLTIPYGAFLQDKARPVVDLFLDLIERIPNLLTDNSIKNSLFVAITKYTAKIDPMEGMNHIISDLLKSDNIVLQAYKNSAKGQPELCDAVGYELAKKKVAIWTFLSEALDQNRLLHLDIDDNEARKNHLIHFTKAPGIPKTEFTKAFDRPHIQREFGKYIQSSIHTWRNLMIEPYLVGLPAALSDMAKTIAQVKAKIENLTNDNTAKAVLNANRHVQLISLNRRLMLLEEHLKSSGANITDNAVLKELEEISRKSRNELLAQKKIELAEKNYRMKLLSRQIHELNSKKCQAERDLENVRDKIIQLPEEIRRLSDGVKAELLFEFRIGADETLYTWHLVPGAKRETFDQMREPREDEKTTHNQLLARDYRGYLEHQALIERKYRIVPKGEPAVQEFLNTNRSGNYIAEIDGVNWEVDTSLGKKANDAGNKVVYAFRTIWRGDGVIPRITITHHIPWEDINEEQINAKRADLIACQNSIIDLEEAVRRHQTNFNALRAEAKELADQRHTLRAEIAKIEADKKTNDIEQLKVSYEELIKSHEKDILTDEAEIVRNKETIKTLLTEITEVKHKFGATFKKKQQLAIIIHTQLEIAHLLRDFAAMAIDDQLGIDNSNKHSQLIGDCADFVKIYKNCINKLKDSCEFDLDSDVTADLESLIHFYCPTEAEADDSQDFTPPDSSDEAESTQQDFATWSNARNSQTFFATAAPAPPVAPTTPNVIPPICTQLYRAFCNLTAPGNRKKQSNIYASGDEIFQQLERYVGEFAHIIPPNLCTASSPLDANQAVCLKGLKKYGEMINGYYDNSGDFHNTGFIQQDGGELKKPVIMILNNVSVTREDGGCHWLCCVILPRNYAPLFADALGNDNERIFFIDSLNSNNQPAQLIKMFAEGCVLKSRREASAEELQANPTTTHYDYRHHVAPPFPRATVVKNPNIKQQQGGFDCGWWAVYNALMLVFTGSNQFMNQFTQPSREPAYVLRELLPLLPEQEAEYVNSLH